VQRLFANHVGDRMLPVTVALAGGSGPTQVLGVSVSRVERDGTLILKVANPSEAAIEAKIVLTGLSRVGAKAERILLAGAKDAANDLAQPERVAPVTSAIEVGVTFACPVPPMSVQIVRVPTRG
jgi:alpha-L-arabinofuranosidase